METKNKNTVIIVDTGQLRGKGIFYREQSIKYEVFSSKYEAEIRGVHGGCGERTAGRSPMCLFFGVSRPLWQVSFFFLNTAVTAVSSRLVSMLATYPIATFVFADGVVVVVPSP